MACEVLARRIVHLTEPDRIKTVLSMRYKHRRSDGDESELSNALEMAIDQHWYFLAFNSTISDDRPETFFSTIFLSSSEAQAGKIFLVPFPMEATDVHKSCQCTLEWSPYSAKQRQ